MWRGRGRDDAVLALVRLHVSLGLVRLVIGHIVTLDGVASRFDAVGTIGRAGGRGSRVHGEVLSLGHKVVDIGDWRGVVPHHKLSEGRVKVFDRRSDSGSYPAHFLYDARKSIGDFRVARSRPKSQGSQPECGGIDDAVHKLCKLRFRR